MIRMIYCMLNVASQSFMQTRSPRTESHGEACRDYDCSCFRCKEVEPTGIL